MKLSNLKAGTRLTLKLESKRREDPYFELTSSFELIDEEGLISILEPLLFRQPYPLPFDEAVSVSFIQDDRRFGFLGQAVNRYQQGNILYTQLKQLSPLENLEQRDDFRLGCSDELTLLCKRFIDDIVVEKNLSVVLRDVSGGGLGFYTNEELESFDEIRVHLPGTDGETVPLEISWIVKNHERAIFSYRIGTRFLYEKSGQKDRVVRHIFELQRKLRQKQKEDRP